MTVEALTSTAPPSPQGKATHPRTIAVVTGVAADDDIVRKVLDEAAPELDNARLRAAIAVQLEEVRASRERIAEAQVLQDKTDIDRAIVRAPVDGVVL